MNRKELVMFILGASIQWFIVGIYSIIAGCLIYQLTGMKVDGGKLSLGAYVTLLIALFMGIKRGVYLETGQDTFNLVVIAVIVVPHVIRFFRFHKSQ